MINFIQGHAPEVGLADESVHCVVTSPPYFGLRSYEGEQMRVWGGDKDHEHEWQWYNRKGMTGGLTEKQVTNIGSFHDPSTFGVCECGAWYGGLGLEPDVNLYVDHIVEVFREIWRVLREDGTVWLVIGDSYNGSGGAGGDYNEGGMREGQPKYPGRNIEGLKRKDMIGVPWRVAFALQEDGWWLRSDVIWSKSNPMPEPVRDRPTKGHEYIFLLAKSEKYFYDRVAIMEPHKEESLKRYEYGFNPQVAGDEQILRANKREGLFGGIDKMADFVDYRGRNKRTVWEIPTKPYSEAHFATYPPALIEVCVKSGTSEHGVCSQCGTPWKRVIEKSEPILNAWSEKGRANYKIEAGRPVEEPEDSKSTLKHYRIIKTEGWEPDCDCIWDCPDKHHPQHWQTPCPICSENLPYPVVPAIVFDPFIGSGTTCLVAEQLGRDSIGVDLSLEYLNMAQERTGLKKWMRWKDGRKKEISSNKEAKVPEQQIVMDL